MIEVQERGCLTVVVLFSVFAFVSAQNYCNTPSGSTGQCIVVKNCPSLLQILQNRNRSPDETQLLKNSQCGTEGRLPKVCCPSASRPTNGGCATGRCVNVRQCPALASLLEGPSTPDVVQALQNAACNGVEPSSVCCAETAQPTPVSPTVTELVDAGLADRLLPEKGMCGQEEFENKIIGGNVTGLEQYPWMGLVEYRSMWGPISPACGATLISPRYIITAGHCVLGSILTEVGTPVSVRLGEFDKRQGVDCLPLYGGRQECNDGPLSITIEQIIAHPDYKPVVGGNKNDIAMIRLASEAPYSSYIRPICLPADDIAQRRSSEPIEVLVAGWGTTENGTGSNVKLHILIPLVSLEKCQIPYNTRGLRSSLWEKQLCAGGDGGKDSCRGDSGGPLMTQEADTHYELHGVVSFGPTPCALANVPGVYTKVFAYLPWIRSVIRE